MIKRKPTEVEFTLEGAEYASMQKENSSGTYFTVTPLGDGLFELWCTHGGWPCQVTADGKAFGDCHFPDGKQMVNTLETEQTSYDYHNSGCD